MEEQEPVTLVSLRVTNSNPKLQVMVPPPEILFWEGEISDPSFSEAVTSSSYLGTWKNLIDD